MGIFDGCLLLSDIDGTLLTKGKIPQKNIEKIEYFKANGGIFAIGTGRAITAAEESYNISHSNAPLVAFHGGCIYDFKTDSMLYSAELPNTCKEVLPTIIKKFPDLGVEIHSGLKVYELVSNKETVWHGNYESICFEKPPYDVYTVPWTKVFLATGSMQTLRELDEYCKQFDCCRFLNTIVAKTGIYYEMLPHGVDKGSALLKLKQILNCTKTFAIGDFYNDVEMLIAADYSAATLGAPDDVKALANTVTVSCEDGAVADFIEKIEQQLKGSKL